MMVTTDIEILVEFASAISISDCVSSLYRPVVGGGGGMTDRSLLMILAHDSFGLVSCDCVSVSDVAIVLQLHYKV